MLKHLAIFDLCRSTVSTDSQIGEMASLKSASSECVAELIISIFSDNHNWVTVVNIFGNTPQHTSPSTLKEYIALVFRVFVLYMF